MKKVIAGIGVFFLLIICAIGGVSPANVLQGESTVEETSIYKQLHAIYVSHVQEVHENNIKSIVESEKSKLEAAAENNRKILPEYIILRSQSQNVCYLASYLMAMHEEIRANINLYQVNETEIKNYLTNTLYLKSNIDQYKEKEAIVINIVTLSTEELAKKMKMSAQQKEIFIFSYEINHAVITQQESMYEVIYGYDENGNLKKMSVKGEPTDEDVVTEIEGTEVFTTVPYYCQWDSKWGKNPYGNGTISSSGCGPTCCAMVVSYFTGLKLTPGALVKRIGNTYYVSGQGSSWSLFPGVAGMYGLQCKNLGKSMESVVAELRKGHVVIASMGPGTFTKGGHFIVLTGITASGEITVNDPSHPDFCKSTFKQSLILSESKNFWSFWKEK